MIDELIRERGSLSIANPDWSKRSHIARALGDLYLQRIGKTPSSPGLYERVAAYFDEH